MSISISFTHLPCSQKSTLSIKFRNCFGGGIFLAAFHCLLTLCFQSFFGLDSVSTQSVSTLISSHMSTSTQSQLSQSVSTHYYSSHFHSWLSVNSFPRTCPLSVNSVSVTLSIHFLFLCQQLNAQCQLSVSHLAYSFNFLFLWSTIQCSVSTQCILFLCQQFNAQCQLIACLVVSLTKGQVSEGYRLRNIFFTVNRVAFARP